MLAILKSKWLVPVALILGLLSGYIGGQDIHTLATVISDVFINLLKLLSLPIIFLSLVATSFRFEDLAELKFMGAKVLRYTLLTTVIAAAVALGLFILIDPASVQLSQSVVDGIGANAENLPTMATAGHGYLHYLTNIVPSNLVQPFLEGNVISVFFMAVVFSLGLLSLPNEKRKPLKSIFMGLYQTVLNITLGVLYLLPIGIWAFVTLFIQELNGSDEMRHLVLYLVCIISANIIQALIVLPVILKAKGISAFKLFKNMWPALSIAFFSKSSSAALPSALERAKNEAKISESVANFSLPLCTTINMNACAAFILITVLFVSMSSGVSFSGVELIGWIFIATIAAVGNASVPMGCYFLATSLLVALGVPVKMMAIILPVYSLIDMLESAINVWSDSCVTAMVDEDIKALGVTEAINSLAGTTEISKKQKISA
tara:strand:- start:14328 stop:15623 length:1296 start_codon:yes stop_codon:yes gene_type:complete